MRVGTIYYNLTLDKTTIKWNDEFMGLKVKHQNGDITSDWLTHADALKDAGNLVDAKYNEILEFRDA